MKKSSPTRRWTGTLRTALRFVAAVVLVFVLLRRTDPRQALDLIRGAKFELLLAGVLIMAIPMAIGGLRWWLLLRSQGLMLPLHFVLRVHLAGYALGSVLPTSVGGDLLRVGYTTKDGMVGAALATVLTDRILGVGGLLIICDFASLLLLVRTGSPGLLALAGTASAIVGLFLLTLIVGPLYDGLSRLAARVRFLHLGDRLIRVAGGIRRYRTHPRLIMLTLSLSVLLWLVHSLVWYVLGASVGSPAPLLRYLVCVPLVALSAMIPISIGGLGVRENSFVMLMSHFGTPEAPAAATALLFLGVLVLYALVGALLFITLRRRAHPLAA
jgi:glycosyltransferase 2 family protein